jgi:cystathionine beta-synthase
VEVADSLLDLVGNTPMVRLGRLRASAGLACDLVAKVELFNPGGSVKDRPAIAMIDAAERAGLLKPGGTIVEPTSGNTGVGLAIVAAQRGYRCIFVMSDKMSDEKVALLRAYGAEVVVCPTAVPPEHPDSYYSVADRLTRETPDAFRPDQYSNPHNPAEHERSTGPEIWRQTDGRLTHFVAGIGTGGTITGVARHLKARNPAVQVIGADPAGSVFSGGTGRPYLVEGVGEDFCRGQRRRVVRGRPAGHPGGGAPHRGLVRHGGARGADRGGRPRSRAPRGGAAARQRSRLPLEDLQRRVDDPLRVPPLGRPHRR